MLLPVGTNPQKHAQVALEKFVDDIFSTDPWKRNTGGKGIKIILPSQNEPTGIYIRLLKLGGRAPLSMGLDQFTLFQEHQLTFMLDIRVSETDNKTPDKKTGGTLKITNFENRDSFSLGTSGETIDNVCNALRTVIEIPEWRMRLSALGVHNPTLTDERESYQGTEYLNPMKLVFDTYVRI